MPSKSPGITKNPSCGHLVFILFMYFLKKASALRRQNAPTVPHIASSYVQWFVRFIRFIRFATSQLFRSFVCACRSRASHRYTRLALRAMLASLTLIHSLIHFALPFIHACLSLTRQSPLHSLGTSCHARFACTHSLHHSTHSFRYFIRSLIPLISRPPPFHILPHMSSFLLAISTIRVASQWDK